jgi:ribosomal protein L16 Arg81 hydroxylase
LAVVTRAAQGIDTVSGESTSALVDYGNLDEIDAALPFTREFQKVFLERYWQKRPLLIRQAIPLFQSPVEPEELAGLLLDGEEVTARIILERDGKQPWEVVRI